MPCWLFIDCASSSHTIFAIASNTADGGLIYDWPPADWGSESKPFVKSNYTLLSKKSFASDVQYTISFLSEMLLGKNPSQ